MKRYLRSVLLAMVLMIGFIQSSVGVKAAAGDNSQTGNYGSFIDGSHVISDLIETSGMNAHPRIIMSEEKFANLRAHIGDGSVTAGLLEDLRGEADRHVRKDPVVTYDADGEDHLLETSKRAQRRIAALALAYNIFGDEKYAKRCYQEMEAACNFKDWSPKHFLDTAEMCTALAFGYDWLYNWMTLEQRKLVRTSLIEKGLMQVMQDYTDSPRDRKRTYKWYQDQVGDNWQLVCTGGTNLAALAIGDEKDARDIASEVLTYGFERAYSFVRRAYSATDGTYIEGLGYWDYATYYLGLQSSALISAAGTDYGLADYEGIEKSAEFVRYMSSNSPKSFSFGDDRESRNTGWAVFLWLGEYLNSPEMSAIRLKNIGHDDDGFRYLDVLWIDESKQAEAGKDNATDWGSVGASNASIRNTWDESGLVAALHVGENNYKYHGHYDLGSFYVESNGSRFFTDLGNESYSLENRQFSYRIKAEGHNTLVINPTKDIDQREGANCLITEFAGGNEAYAVTDLTDAYGPSDAKSVIRGLKMIKGKECVVIQDEISLHNPGEIYWFAHTKGQIDVAADGRSAVVTVGSDRLWVGLLSEGGRFTAMAAEPLETSLTISGATSNNEYRKLAIHLTNTKDVTISVACIPLKNDETSPSWTPSVKSISEWARGVEIVTQPVDASVDAGTTVTFSVAATGDGLRYQWQYKNASADTWSNSGVSAARTANMRFTAGTDKSLNGRQYRCVITDKNGKSAISNAATLTVIQRLALVGQPMNSTAAVGDKVRFTVAATGEGLTYQWQYKDAAGSDWSDSGVSAAKTTNMTFTVVNNKSLNGRQYRCIVTDRSGERIISDAATLTVGVGLAVTNQPADQTAAAGARVSFTVAANGGGLSYQWQYRNAGASTWSNSGIAAAKTANMTFTVGTDKSLNGRQYRCIVTDKNGKTVTSNAATLTVK